MKKTNLLIAIMLLLSATVSSWAAERVAPTLPEFATLEAGKEYYLYNVGSGTFLSKSSSTPKMDSYGSKVLVGEVSEKGFYIQYTDDSRYLYTSSSIGATSSLGNTSYYAVNDSLGGYTIQCAEVNTSYYNAEQFLGVADAAISSTLTEGNIVWQFMDVEKAERYFALHKLYTALEATDGTAFNVDKFEAIYANKASTNEELTAAATTLNDAMSLTTSYTAPDWADFPMLLETNGCEWSTSSSNIYMSSTTDISLTGTVTVDKDATIVYQILYSTGLNLWVYIDGKLVRIIDNTVIDTNDYTFCERITAGTHTIQLVYPNTSGSNKKMPMRIGVESTPTVEVSLLEPGSLGTEVLYNVDHIKDVRRLKVKGEMNSDDWAKISMMTSLFSLDLSEAKITEIPYRQFTNEYEDCAFLHEIKLPEGLTDIKNEAFGFSNIDNITFPSTLKTIGKEAFYRSLIKEAILPDSMTSIGDYAFNHCRNLTTVHYPKGLNYVPQYCFNACHLLKTCPLPEGLTRINNYAFSSTYSYNPRFPKSLTHIGNHAFNDSRIDSLILYPSTTSIGSYAFEQCVSLVYAEFPTSYSIINGSAILRNCRSLKEVVFKSPTVVTGSGKDRFFEYGPTDITIKVPSFLVNAYKLDEYWYNYNIEGFSTADIKDWVISQPLVLNARERFEGKPNLTISGSGSLKINGEDEMTIDSLTIISGTKFISNCDNISIDGKLTHNYYTSANYWYFVSMPFDFIVGEITAGNNAKYAIRYYDGAARAANGTGGSWKNFAATDTVKAGTGFIFCTSVDSYLTFTSLENESKQYVVSNEEFVKALDANVSETASNSGWNLVGNPWQAYYNIHILNFTAPITTWSVTNKTYSAYSIIDDDYAISPNQAFFVQCPDEVVSISFPVGGRQLTSEITTQQGTTTQARELGIIDRQLVDIALTSNGLTDKTRIVFNDAAAMAYEPACDASKFFTMESGVSQVYTIDNEGNNYSINERPETDGVVKVGVMIATSGKHTFSLQRNKAESVVLVDQATGVSHDLMASDYEFSAEAGTYNDRFVLNIKKAPGTTGIDNAAADNVSVTAVEGGIEIAGVLGTVNVYSVDGRLAATIEADGTAATVSLDNGVYIVKAANKTAKVVVK